MSPPPLDHRLPSSSAHDGSVPATDFLPLKRKPDLEWPPLGEGSTTHLLPLICACRQSEVENGLNTLHPRLPPASVEYTSQSESASTLNQEPLEFSPRPWSSHTNRVREDKRKKKWGRNECIMGRYSVIIQQHRAIDPRSCHGSWEICFRCQSFGVDKV